MPNALPTTSQSSPALPHYRILDRRRNAGVEMRTKVSGFLWEPLVGDKRPCSSIRTEIINLLIFLSLWDRLLTQPSGAKRQSTFSLQIPALDYRHRHVCIIGKGSLANEGKHKAAWKQQLLPRNLRWWPFQCWSNSLRVLTPRCCSD